MPIYQKIDRLNMRVSRPWIGSSSWRLWRLLDNLVLRGRGCESAYGSISEITGGMRPRMQSFFLQA